MLWAGVVGVIAIALGMAVTLAAIGMASMVAHRLIIAEGRSQEIGRFTAIAASLREKKFREREELAPRLVAAFNLPPASGRGGNGGGGGIGGGSGGGGGGEVGGTAAEMMDEDPASADM